VNEDENDDDDENNGIQSNNFFSQMKTHIEIQKALFQKKALERRQHGRAYSVGSKGGSLIRHSNVDKVDDNLTDQGLFRTTPSSGHSSESYLYHEDDEADYVSLNRSIAVDPDISTLSDLDGNKIETVNASHRLVRVHSIESRSGTDSSIHQETLHPAESFLDAPTPKVQNNNVPSSFATQMDGMYLPSVCIDNAEAGMVRWRQFPIVPVQAKTARKLDFCLSDEDNHRLAHSHQYLDVPDEKRPSENFDVHEQLGAVATESCKPAHGGSIREMIKVRSIRCIGIDAFVCHDADKLTR
jgi:hypothetical protein